jgi:hypothetical protein
MIFGANIHKGLQPKAPNYDWKCNGLDLPADDFIRLDFWAENLDGRKMVVIPARSRSLLHSEGRTHEREEMAGTE